MEDREALCPAPLAPVTRLRRVESVGGETPGVRAAVQFGIEGHEPADLGVTLPGALTRLAEITHRRPVGLVENRLGDRVGREIGNRCFSSRAGILVAGTRTQGALQQLMGPRKTPHQGAPERVDTPCREAGEVPGRGCRHAPKPEQSARGGSENFSRGRNAHIPEASEHPRFDLTAVPMGVVFDQEKVVRIAEGAKARNVLGLAEIVKHQKRPIARLQAGLEGAPIGSEIFTLAIEAMREPALSQGMQHDFADVFREKDAIARFETERIETDLQGRSGVGEASNREAF